MAQLFNPREFTINIKKTQYQVKKVFRSAWPIQWSIFRTPKALFDVIQQAQYPVRVAFGIGAIGILVSLIFLMFGTYAATTKEVGQDGGQIREAVFGEMNNFLPVLELNNDAEKKVSRLLFHPLYEVNFSNFTDNASQQSTQPILITETPIWIDTPNATTPLYKRLRFNLRDNLKWSDGSALTIADVEYTFNLLKSPNSNSQFSKTFSTVTFEKIKGNQFDLVNTEANPGLLLAANFSPISRAYFGDLPLDRIAADPRKVTPTTTSGYFTMVLQNVSNPDSPQTKTNNPIRDANTQAIRTVVLNKNPQSNTSISPYIQTYIIKKYDSVQTQGDINSIISDTNTGKVDIFTRNLISSIDLANTPDTIKKATSLNQSIIPNNTYITAFANAGRSNSGEFGVLVNQSLRRYVMCYLNRFNPGTAYSNFFSDLPADKKIVPMQLNVKASPDCPADLSTVLDKNTYEIVHDDSRSPKRLWRVINGRRVAEIRLDLVWGVSSESLKNELVNYFLIEAGVPISTVIQGAKIPDVLATGNYNLVIYPLTLANSDPYSIYGANGLNWTRMGSSNKQSIIDVNPEALLKRYSASNRTDKEARDALGQFFAKEYLTLSMWQGNTEINLNPRIGGVTQSLPTQLTFSTDVYNKLPNWHVQTRREWNWVENIRD